MANSTDEPHRNGTPPRDDVPGYGDRGPRGTAGDTPANDDDSAAGELDIAFEPEDDD